MSLFDCIQRAMDDTGPEGINASKERGQRAQEEWRKRADRYEAEGHLGINLEARSAYL